MTRRMTVWVRIDRELVEAAKDALGARTNVDAVELAVTIALAIREQPDGPSPYRDLLKTGRFKL